MTDPIDIRTARSEYLLDGRRVLVSDLLQAELLRPGDQLRFIRSRAGETHRAVVRDDGWLVLDDGRAFHSPSRAATVAARVRAVDGWHAWVVEQSGRSLDSLRAELLDREVAPEETSPTVSAEISGAQTRHGRLKDARARADQNDPVTLSVRELLDWWGARSRGSRITERIEADLANHDLVTSPSFLKVTPDTPVRLVSAGAEEPPPDELPRLTGTGPADPSGTTAASVGPDPSTEGSDSDEPELPLGLTIGNLPSALGGVIFVTSQATFEEVITKMLLNDFSQLAVLNGPRTLIGAVSWKSIAQARNANPSATLADAVVAAPEARFDRELIDVLPTLQASDYLFVRDQTGVVSGIVTAADVVNAYGELATPFFLIGELDQLLRHVVARNFSLTEVTALAGPSPSRPVLSFDDLSMGDYQRALENPGLWSRLAWPLDRVTFIKRLAELREIRNDVMHFNPDPVPPSAVDMLRNIVRVLRRYGD